MANQEEFHTIVADHDRGVYSVHRTVSDERAIAAVTAQNDKGRHMAIAISRTAHKVVAEREASELHPNYHHVQNALEE